VTRFRKPEAVSTAVSGEALLVVHLDRGTAFRLNGTARLMWDLASAGRTADEIAGSLAGRLAAPPERLCADASALIEELSAQALLEPAGGEP
jgi:hypothetical protein